MIERGTYRKTMKYLFSGILTSFLALCATNKGLAKSVEYSVVERSDGGYTLKIVYSKRHLKPITAEGFFPVEKKSYTIEVIGRGRDWKYRNQNGYFYSSEEIKSSPTAWDFGYAWIDADRTYLYLNFYWVISPNNMEPSDINGKYYLKRAEKKEY